MPAGRPTDYKQTIADTICTRLCEGERLRKICAAKDMPALSTVFRWLSLFPEFSEQYARAREVQADALFDEILHLADTPQMGKRLKRIGKGKDATVEETTGDMIEHRRLQIDARKWIAGKLRPKRYGDKRGEQWATLQRDLVDINKSISEVQGTLRWIGRTIIGAILVAAVAFMVRGGFAP